MNWTRESAIDAVRKFAAKHGYQPISSEAGRHYGLPPWHIAKRLFGSWNAMIEAAGYRPYPARSSALAKTLAYRDRHPNWRAELSTKAKRRIAEYDTREAAA